MMHRNFLNGCLLSLFLFFLYFPLRAQDSRITISFFGGLNHVGEYGTVDDYVQGENDFPVTPSHTPFCFGVALGFELIRGLGLEADFRYHLSSSLVLEDPSDGDSISIDSSKHFTMSGNLTYRFSSGTVKPYLLFGAGIDFLSGAKTQTLTSEYGYGITLFPPDDTSDIMVNAGGGCLFRLSRKIGLRLDARYVHIFRSEDLSAIDSFNTAAGIILFF